MRTKSESGIAHVILLILVLGVLAGIIYVGTVVVANQNTGESSAAPVASTKTTAPDSINTDSDLTKTKAALNQTDIDGDVNPDSLNADIDSVL